MSAIAKSTNPVAPTATESRDWTKASTPELQSGSKDESNVLDTKAKERHRHKQRGRRSSTRKRQRDEHMKRQR